MMLRKFFTSYLWIALLTTGLVMVMDQKIIPGRGTWNILELRSIDARFLLKSPSANRAAQDVVLILIDEESYKKINQPLIFYNTHIAEVVNYLVRSGAKVIGLDIELPSISLQDRISGDYDSVYPRALLKAKKQGVDVVIGYSSEKNPPLSSYLAAAGQRNLSAFTLTVDQDDFIRRQQLVFTSDQGSCDAFAYLLAKKFAGKALPPPGPVILIDYSLGGEISSYPFHEVHKLSSQNSPPDNRFKDKVVIIGGMFTFEDRHPTPPNRFPGGGSRRTAGAVIHATTLVTLLSQSFFQEPGSWAGGGYIFLASLLAVVCCYRRRPLAGALLCLLEAGLIVLISIWAFDRLYVIRLTPLLAAVFLSYGATTVFHYYTEERQRLRIRARFASFVPEKIIDRIVDMDPSRLMDGEQREVALFFSDIRDFTPYAEKNRHDPKKIVNFLNRYHTEMTEIILAHNGTVSQLTGDGIFAFFGAPVAVAEPVLDAVKSAVRMRERVAELKAVWQEYGIEDLRIGIGIHVGHAIVGTMGSLKKMDYTAIGDNTNVASRIEGLTKKFHEVILMSGAAFQQVQDRVAARLLGEAEIKGHSNITLYALDDIKTE